MGEIIGKIISVLFILFMNPYATVAIAVALLIVIFVAIFFGVEAITMSKRLVTKAFYCPFRKTNVEVKLRPSIFTYRAYDDVIKCSAFKGKITCGKRCLDLQELRA